VSSKQLSMNENHRWILEELSGPLLTIQDWGELVLWIIQGGIRLIGGRGGMFCMYDLTLKQIIPHGSFGLFEGEPKEIIKYCKFFFDKTPSTPFKGENGFFYIESEQGFVFLLPLRQKQEIYGILAIVADMNEISDDQITLLKTWMQCGSLAVENSRLYLQIQRKSEGLTLINQLQLLVGRGSFQDLLTETVESIGRFLSSSMAGIMLYDPSRNELVLQKPAFGTWDKQVIEQYRVSLDEGGNAVSVFLSGIPTITNDPHNDPRYIKRFYNMFRTNNVITVPLIVEGRRIGILHAINKIDGVFTHEDVLKLEEISNHLGIILDGALQMEHQHTKPVQRSEIERYLSRQLVRNMLYGNKMDMDMDIDTDEWKNRSHVLKVPSHPPYAVMVIGIYHQEDTWCPQLLIDYIDDIEKQIRLILPISGITLEENYSVIVWTPNTLLEIEGISERLQKKLQHLIQRWELGTKYENIQFFIGIGQPVHSFEQIQSSFIQAKQILKILPQISIKKNVGYYPKLGIWSLFAELSMKEEVSRVFLHSYLNVINSMKKSDDVKKTLANYVANDGQMQKTAEELDIHPNTLKYRLEKVKDETGLDLKDPETRFHLNVALRLENFVKKKMR
jgi:putative methionine-R-sulfoxide reductase with GAF domain